MTHVIAIRKPKLAFGTTSPLPTASVGAFYSQQLQGVGGNGPYAWTMSPSSVNGLTLSSTGLLSGTAASAETDTLGITLSDSLNSITGNFTLVTSGGSAFALTGRAISSAQGTITAGITRALVGQKITSHQGTLTASISALSRALTGAAITSTRGTITPGLTLGLTGAKITSKQGTITSGLPLAISTTSLPNGTTGTQYSQALIATGGVPPYAWNWESFKPHRGLWMTTNTLGTVQGTPQYAETITGIWRVTDSSPDPQTLLTNPLTFSITATGALAVVTTALPTGTVGGMYGALLIAQGGVPPYIWSLSGAIGSTTFNCERNGLVTAAPTVAGANSFVATVTDSAGTTAVSGTISVPVNTALNINLVDNVDGLLRIPAGYASTKYGSAGPRFTAAGGTPPYTWALVFGSLNGLTVGSTGTLSGTLGASAGAITGTLQVTDNVGAANSVGILGNVFPKNQVTRPAYNTGTGFFVHSDGTFRDPNGFRFHMRGYNRDVYTNNEHAAWITLNPNTCRFTGNQSNMAPTSPNMGVYMTTMSADHLTQKQFAFFQCFRTQPAGTIPAPSDVGAFTSGLQRSLSTGFTDISNIVAWFVNSFSSFTANANGGIGLANEYGPPGSAHAAASTGYRNIYSAVGFNAAGAANMPVASVSVSATAVITLGAGVAGGSNPFANATMASIFQATGTINGVVGNVTATGGVAGAWTITTDINNASGQWSSGGNLYGGAVGILRAKGYTCPIFIDSGNFGQFENNIETYAATINNADPQKNCVFNFHAYNDATAAQCQIKSVSAGATTTLTLNSASAHHPFEQAPAGSGFAPFFGVVLQGMLGGSWAGANGSYIGPGNNTGGASPNWTITSVPLTSTGFTGYVANSGTAMDWGHPTAVGARFEGLRAQGVCAFIEEFGASTNTGPSPTYLSVTDVIEGMEAYGCGWTAWAMDDGPAFFGILNNQNTYTSPSSLSVQIGQQIVMHPRMSCFVLATAPPSTL